MTKCSPLNLRNPPRNFRAARAEDFPRSGASHMQSCERLISLPRYHNIELATWKNDEFTLFRRRYFMIPSLKPIGLTSSVVATIRALIHVVAAVRIGLRGILGGSLECGHMWCKSANSAATICPLHRRRFHSLSHDISFVNRWGLFVTRDSLPILYEWIFLLSFSSSILIYYISVHNNIWLSAAAPNLCFIN